MSKQASRDTYLIEKTLEGDAGAYGDLVDRYSQRIVNLAYMMMGDRHTAEDVAQEAFIRAFKALSRFKREAKFSSWVYQIALNLCRDKLKSKSRKDKSMDKDKLVALDGGTTRFGATKQVLRGEFSKLLQEAIKGLPFVYREAFILRHLQSLEYDEIAEITHVSADTARVRAYRARDLLKKSLSPNVDTYWKELAAKMK